MTPLDAAAVGGAIERSLPILLAVDPTAWDADLEILADRLAPCGAVSEFDDGAYWYRIWLLYGGQGCNDGGLEGFAQQYTLAIDPVTYPGMTGTYTSTYWTADAWSGDLHVLGTATWGVQDVVYDDGSTFAYTWVEGDLDRDTPDDETTPSMYRARSVDPDGNVTFLLGGTALVDGDDVDALNVTDVQLGEGCVGVAGIVSVHATDGDWYDVTLTTSDTDCQACGEVTDTFGTPLGSTCIDVRPLLDLGDRR